MKFLHPQILWFLLVAPALVAAYIALLRRKKKHVIRYASVGLVKEAIGPAQRFRRHIPPLLFLLAQIALIIACADPLCCSDGCERGGMAATHSTQTGADCPTCLSAVVPRHDAPLVRVETVTQMRDLSAPAPISLFRTDVDHPPRLT